MQKIVGRIIQFLGWTCAAWFGFVGGSFCAVYLMGFIGTGGREAGHELFLALGITFAGVVVGLIIGKLGAWLATHDSRFDA